MTTIESTQEYHRHAVEKAILNLSPEDESGPDVKNALSWLRSMSWEVALTQPVPPEAGDGLLTPEQRKSLIEAVNDPKLIRVELESHPCQCIDCGGTENEHSTTCAYMHELFGEEEPLSCHWVVRRTAQGEPHERHYRSPDGQPVSEEHVMNDPGVKEWVARSYFIDCKPVEEPTAPGELMRLNDQIGSLEEFIEDTGDTIAQLGQAEYDRLCTELQGLYAKRASL